MAACRRSCGTLIVVSWGYSVMSILTFDLTSRNLLDESGLPRPTRGRDPKIGGELNLYDLPAYWMFFQPEFQGIQGVVAAARAKRIRGARQGAYPVIFINGMQGNPEKHRMQALATSAVTGGSVWGIYNAGNTKGSQSMLADLQHCVNLKTTSSLRREISVGIDRVIEKVTGANGVAEQNLREFLQKDDPASAALFDCLCLPRFRNARICAHSQGNIITSNALNALIALKGKTAVAEMRVYAFGSPVTFWSDADSIVRKHEFSNDAITWLAMNRSPAPEVKESSANDPVLRGSRPSQPGVKDHGARQLAVGWTTAKGSEVPISRTAFSTNPGNLLTHSYFLYMQELWETLVPEFE